MAMNRFKEQMMVKNVHQNWNSCWNINFPPSERENEKENALASSVCVKEHDTNLVNEY